MPTTMTMPSHGRRGSLQAFSNVSYFMKQVNKQPEAVPNLLFDLTKQGLADCLEVLLQQGINPHLKNKDGLTLADIAVLHGQVEATEILTKAGVRASCLPQKVAPGVFNLHWHLAQTNKVIQVNDLYQPNQIAALEVLLQNDKRLQQRCFFSAVLSEDSVWMLRLIKLGIDINTTDFLGNTASHIAAYIGNPHLLEVLAAYGANFDMPNERGDIALDVAHLHRHQQCIEVLFPYTTRKYLTR